MAGAQLSLNYGGFGFVSKSLDEPLGLSPTYQSVPIQLHL